MVTWIIAYIRPKILKKLNQHHCSKLLRFGWWSTIKLKVQQCLLDSPIGVDCYQLYLTAIGPSDNHVMLDSVSFYFQLIYSSHRNAGYRWRCYVAWCTVLLVFFLINISWWYQTWCFIFILCEARLHLWIIIFIILALASSCPKPAFHKMLISDINRKRIKRFSFLLRAMMFFNWAKFVNCSFMDWNMHHF